MVLYILYWVPHVGDLEYSCRRWCSPCLWMIQLLKIKVMVTFWGKCGRLKNFIPWQKCIWIISSNPPLFLSLQVACFLLNLFFADLTETKWNGDSVVGEHGQKQNDHDLLLLHGTTTTTTTFKLENQMKMVTWRASLFQAKVGLNVALDLVNVLALPYKYFSVHFTIRHFWSILIGWKFWVTNQIALRISVE